MNLILLPIISLFYVILLAIFYFRKARISDLENNIYKNLLLSNIFGLLIELGCFYAVPNADKIPLFTFIITRLLLVYYLYFISVYTSYVFVISFKKQKGTSNKFNIFFKKLTRYISLILIVFSTLMVLLPLDYFYDGTYVYSYGTAVNFLQLVFVLVMGLWIFVLVKNSKNLKLNKSIPVIIFIILSGVAGFVQMLYPHILLTTPLETLVIFLMFFTIENPDAKIIEEVHKAKEISDNANEEKTMFLYNMTNEIREITKDIESSASAILEETDNKKINIEAINDSAREIKGSTAKFTTMTNELLDISQIDSSSIKIYNDKYNIKLIIKELIQIYKNKCEEKNIIFRPSIASDVPEYLYGDSVGLKSTLNIILDNSVKYTENGYVEFNVSSIMKKDVCRLIITIEDSGKGMKAEELNKIFNTKKEVKEDSLNLKNNLINAKKLITLMNGTIIPSSIYGKGTTMKIVLDQKVFEEENEITKFESLYDKKKILLVDDNKASQKLISKILTDTNIEIDIVSMGKECLDKIRNKEKYDLILLDEEMQPLDGITVMKKLQEIRNFNIKVILLTRNNNYEYDEEYLKYGFSDYILKPIVKDNFIEKLDKHLK